MPALKTLRLVERVGDRYGLKQRAAAGIAKLAKMEGYDNALKKVKEIEARHGFPASGARFEEEDAPRATTRALGEEGGRRVTTYRYGEE